jgi:hypothetical protein
MNNFYIVICFFFATKLLRDSNKNLEYLFGGYPIRYIFDVHSQCKSKIFLSGFRWNDMFFESTPSIGVVYIWVVCT